MKIVVEELPTVMFYFDQIKVYRSTTGEEGVYVEITDAGTRIDLVVDQTLYEYVDTAGDPLYWYRFSYFHSSTLAESSASTPIQPEGAQGRYCTLQDIRDEGVTEAMLSNERALELIDDASEYIEMVTGRWFDPRGRTLRVRATGTPILSIGPPIIQVDELYVLSGRGANMTRAEISVDDVLVFNRHLTEGLKNPDDRDDPKLEYSGLFGLEYPGSGLTGTFPRESQVIEIVGTFGYTSLPRSVTPGETSDGSQAPNHHGVTPGLIRKACKLLTIRDADLMSDPEGRADLRDAWRIESQKTADQAYKMTPLSSLKLTGAATGDPEIDGILMGFMAPAAMGVA
jgi:hypothetical protein